MIVCSEDLCFGDALGMAFAFNMRPRPRPRDQERVRERHRLKKTPDATLEFHFAALGVTILRSQTILDTTEQCGNYSKVCVVWYLLWGATGKKVDA